jgi:hypothetical protein
MTQDVATEASESTEAGGGRILASATSDGLRIDVVEFEDKSLAITFDRRPRLGYRWGADQIEPCVNTFVRLMRH